MRSLSAQGHWDAPVLLVEVAGRVQRDLPVLGAVAGRGPGGDVQDTGVDAIGDLDRPLQTFAAAGTCGDELRRS